MDGPGKSNLDELGDLFGSMNAGAATTNQTADVSSFIDMISRHSSLWYSNVCMLNISTAPVYLFL